MRSERLSVRRFGRDRSGRFDRQILAQRGRHLYANWLKGGVIGCDAAMDAYVVGDWDRGPVVGAICDHEREHGFIGTAKLGSACKLDDCVNAG